MLFVSNQTTFGLKKGSASKKHFIYDAGFHLDLKSNNADCGGLIDLMTPELEPSTIIFWAT